MASGFRSSVRISKPPRQVWDALTDWSGAARWMKGVDSMRPQGDGPVGEGSVLLFVARGAERASTVTGWRPPEMLELTSEQGGMSATYRYELVPAEEGAATELTLDAGCRAVGGIGWRLIAPLIGKLMAASDRGQPQALRAALEDQNST